MVRYYCSSHRRETTSPGYRGHSDADFRELTPSDLDGGETCGCADGRCTNRAEYAWDGGGDGPDPETAD
ncbi:hypothetical protein DP107_13110 [Haloglomus irregulare]|jgi:hypothetical protein|uniref:Uncharacterized protein n=1 Tax=Haloglomus irregulare TaxID=2234134 RepID=A0A554MYS7_9EURY|nr:hypothetical protein [Haloglomus irregulare]TSD09930.1 hypothetical protein DP107_13110 [Haloglomus irregulare]